MPADYHYRHSGLLVASQIELPEWGRFACDAQPPDVRILVAQEPSPQCPLAGSVAEGDSLRFGVEDIGCWQMEGGRVIRIHPAGGVREEELRLFTLGSAWGALGYQRGFAMWHASAVERGGNAVLFCGDTGEGKSTLAAAQSAAGARLVADDLCRVQPTDRGAVIYPSSARIKLWRTAIDRLGWQDRILQRDYFRDDKFHCQAQGAIAGNTPLDLAAIVVLGQSETPVLERLGGATGFEAVMKATLYRPDMIDALGLWGQQGGLAAKILARVPVWRLGRPRTFDFDAETQLLAPLFEPL